MTLCKELDNLSFRHSYESVGLKLILKSDEFISKAFNMKVFDHLNNKCFEIVPRSCTHYAGLNKNVIKCSKMSNHKINSVLPIN